MVIKNGVGSTSTASGSAASVAITLPIEHCLAAGFAMHLQWKTEQQLQLTEHQ